MSIIAVKIIRRPLLMKKTIPLFIIMMVVSSCGGTYIDNIRDVIYSDNTPKDVLLGYEIVDVADIYVGMHERRDRQTLRQFIGVDPVSTEWCAAFINSVLREVNLPGSDFYHDNPLLARSFLTWGEEVIGKPQTGDIVVFRRGNQGWQGHVGFFMASYRENGREYYVILGGNQNNEVSYEAYEAKRAIAIRRWPTYDYF
jgi:uncharacterized protein (TIGR02594 family)